MLSEDMIPGFDAHDKGLRRTFTIWGLRMKSRPNGQKDFLFIHSAVRRGGEGGEGEEGRERVAVACGSRF